MNTPNASSSVGPSDGCPNSTAGVLQGADASDHTSTRLLKSGIGGKPTHYPQLSMLSSDERSTPVATLAPVEGTVKQIESGTHQSRNSSINLLDLPSGIRRIIYESALRFRGPVSICGNLDGSFTANLCPSIRGRTALPMLSVTPARTWLLHSGNEPPKLYLPKEISLPHVARATRAEALEILFSVNEITFTISEEWSTRYSIYHRPSYNRDLQRFCQQFPTLANRIQQLHLWEQFTSFAKKGVTKIWMSELRQHLTNLQVLEFDFSIYFNMGSLDNLVLTDEQLESYCILLHPDPKHRPLRRITCRFGNFPGPSLRTSGDLVQRPSPQILYRFRIIREIILRTLNKLREHAERHGRYSIVDSEPPILVPQAGVPERCTMTNAYLILELM